MLPILHLAATLPTINVTSRCVEIDPNHPEHSSYLRSGTLYKVEFEDRRGRPNGHGEMFLKDIRTLERLGVYSVRWPSLM